MKESYDCDCGICSICNGLRRPGEFRMDKQGKLLRFRDAPPAYKDWFAFVCPVQKDRWEIGWMDDYKVRVEGGESYRLDELTYYVPLPAVPNDLEKVK